MAADYSQYKDNLVEKTNRVMTITLNVPDRLSAFTGPMHTALSRIWTT